MGTSGIFGGSKSGLVPSWVDDLPSTPIAAPGDGALISGDSGGDGDGDSNNPVLLPTAYPPLRPIPAGSRFSDARGNLTRGTRTSDSAAIRRGVRQYVTASGGGRGAARRMPSSLAMAGGIASLAHSFVTQGPVAALRPFNLERLAGAPAVNVFIALKDVLCPPGGMIDEAIAGDAMLEAIALLADKGVGNFDELTAEDIQEFFINVVSKSIEIKILNEVGTNSIRISPSLTAIERAQCMLYDFIDGCVRDQFVKSGSSLTNITSKQIDGFISDLYAAAFDLMQILGKES